MPDIDRTADIKVTAVPGTVTAEIPLAGHASEHWLELFRSLAAHRMRELHAEAEDREDRTWVVVWLPSARPDFRPELTLDAARALISEVHGMDQQLQSGVTRIEVAIREWWARQQSAEPN
jgi:hypothetical protein